VLIRSEKENFKSRSFHCVMSFVSRQLPMCVTVPDHTCFHKIIFVSQLHQVLYCYTHDNSHWTCSSDAPRDVRVFISTYVASIPQTILDWGWVGVQWENEKFLSDSHLSGWWVIKAKCWKQCLWTPYRVYRSTGYSKTQGSKLRDSLTSTGSGAIHNECRFISVADGEPRINQLCSYSRGEKYL